MPSNKDPRKVVDARVHIKATHLTSPAECSRLYGSLAKTKLVDGIVTKVVVDRSMMRARTFLEARWVLTTQKQPLKLIALCNVLSGPTPETLRAEALPEGEREKINQLVNQESWDQSELLDDDDPAKTFAGEQEDVCRTVVASAHDVDWHAEKDETPIGGQIIRRNWTVRTCVGDVIHEDAGVSDKTPYLYFLSMYPRRHLPKIVALSNVELKKRKERITTPGEILKFFGILVLMTRWEFGSRRELWSTESRNPLLPVPNFGTRTGMSRRRFDNLIASIRFSEPNPAYANSDIVSFRWGLVQGFVDAFNEHRAMYVTPSELICVDESISRWYVLGGHWIELGLPHYVAIDRKPENGFEIQNSACGRSGIMLHLELVSTADDEAGREYEGDGLHGTAVLRRVVKTWAGTRRIVCADSYYASVEACEELEKMGLRFIGVVKTATRRFPMKFLSELQMEKRGEWRSVVRKDADGKVSKMAVVWMDRERRYFIANASTALSTTPYKRIRWRQLDNGPAKQELIIDQPEVAEVYYKS